MYGSWWKHTGGCMSVCYFMWFCGTVGPEDNVRRIGSRLYPQFAFHTYATKREVLCTNVFTTATNPPQYLGKGGCSRQRKEVTDSFCCRDHVIFFTKHRHRHQLLSAWTLQHLCRCLLTLTPSPEVSRSGCENTAGFNVSNCDLWIWAIQIQFDWLIYFKTIRNFKTYIKYDRYEGKSDHLNQSHILFPPILTGYHQADITEPVSVKPWLSQALIHPASITLLNKETCWFGHLSQ